jgi:hypothetical protein
MLSLAELQERFSACLRAGESGQVGLEGMVAPGVPPSASLAIYRNNVRSRFADALADVFPATRRIVGDAFFRFAAGCFVEAHPSRAGTLIGFGREFPVFLRAFEPAASLPYLPDVAALEFLHRDAFHAADAPPLDAGLLHALADRHGDALCLTLHPSVRLLSAPFAVLDVWQANLQDDPAPMTIAGHAEHLLIIRPDADVHVRRVTEAGFAVLAALGDGLPLGRSIEAAASLPGADALPAELAALIAHGAFTHAHLETRT